MPLAGDYCVRPEGHPPYCRTAKSEDRQKNPAVRARRNETQRDRYANDPMNRLKATVRARRNDQLRRVRASTPPEN